MLLRNKLALLLLIGCIVNPGEAFLLPLLFPLSIRITFHSNTKPTEAPSYHFESVPVYREVVVKGSAHISPVSPVKHSYGDGQKYGTSYGDGHVKVYTEEPHIRGHKYATGYGTSSGTGGSIDGHFTISSYPVADSGHYKGTPYEGDGGSHYKGVPYPQAGYSDEGAPYDVEEPPTHYKGTAYSPKAPPTHYKGTAYGDKAPPTHYKGVAYGEKLPPTHYKGTAYEEDGPVDYKGILYDDDQAPYKGATGGRKPRPTVYKPNEYIKAVGGGGYKVSDYINSDKTSVKYPSDDGDQYVVEVPPKKTTFAEYEAAHKAPYSPPKAYSADQYADLGASTKYKKEYEHEPSYLDDTLPEYKANIPRPRPQRPQYRLLQASASRYDKVVPQTKEVAAKTTYAGFGTSIYGDSYASIVYVPKNLRISIRAYARS